MSLMNCANKISATKTGGAGLINFYEFTKKDTVFIRITKTTASRYRFE